MGKGSPPPPPPAPNFTAVATQQAEFDREAAREATFANRPDVITPFTSSRWVQTGPANQPKWTQTTDVDPSVESTLQTQFGLGEQRADAASGMFGRVEDAYRDPVDYGQFSQVEDIAGAGDIRQRAEDAMFQKSTARLGPRLQEAEQDLQVRLRNQGLRPGDQAYDREMRRFDESKTDAYEQARLGAVTEGRAEAGQQFGQQQAQQQQQEARRQNQIAEELRRRGLPLREINDLLAGQGIQPAAATGPAGGSQQTISGPNLLGAAQSQYGAQADAFNLAQGQRQAKQQGFSQLLGTGLQAASMFSDRRLKTDIEYVGNWRDTPYPAYTFKYRGEGKVHVGVMSDEINPSAVIEHASGFDVVNYERIA